jgi:glycosidase
MLHRLLFRLAVLAVLLLANRPARAEAMLQLFNVNWDELQRRIPEIAEAGYTSLWLPPPAKAGSVFSVGYDLFDPFDLGDKHQRGTVRTRYGTKAELQQVVELAHRFGLRVYFDNIMNHRGFEVPGFNASTPTNLYPGLVPGDFHVQTVGGRYANWPRIENYGNVSEVQNQPLFGLIDLANEPGAANWNFGTTLGSTAAKPVLTRQPGNPEYYMDASRPSIGGPWKPFNGTLGTPVPEDVNSYLIRAAMWLVHETRCDGFRFDAVKHVPSGFFGATSATFDGYSGGIQAMFDYVHGYGNNVRTNGYLEGDDSRNSCFNSEAVRNDAMLFGEHLGEPPFYQEYLDRGMRLLNAPYHSHLNSVLGQPGGTLAGMEQRDFQPGGSGFSGAFSVLFAQSHDDGYASRRELHHAYNFFREGVPSIYSDGYNEATAAPGEQPFPRVASAPFLGQFGDPKMPDLSWLHQHLARGGTRPRWGDADVVAFERYDYREVNAATAFTNPDATVVLFAMNDNYAADISFDDGAAQSTNGTYYDCFPVSNTRGVGLVVGFPPGSVLYQLADSPNAGSSCGRLLVRQATASLAEAQGTVNHPDPAQRKIFVGAQTLAPGGGAIELRIPRGGYVAYAYQPPGPSYPAPEDAIVLRQGGGETRRVTIQRHDGVNGDPNFNPTYPFKVRGSVDPSGNVLGGVNVSNRTYAIDIPILTNGPLDVIVRADASAAGALLKLDGGVDVNSQMGLGPLSGLDRRDYRPGHVTDVWLGYEASLLQRRVGPEKFAARSVSRNNVTSAGAETYRYTVGGGSNVVNGAGNGSSFTAETAQWVYHDPVAPATVTGGPPTQRHPVAPAAGQSAELWVKVGYKFQINRCFIYYTTDGTNPEGSLGVGAGTTQVIEAGWMGDDTADGNIDWWRGTISAAAHVAGRELRYKVALFKDGAQVVSDADEAKRYGLTEFGVTNFNPDAATVWKHNNLNTNDTATGLAEGFHILRARTLLPRDGKSSVIGTFAQTFYYDAQPPAGQIAFPAAGGTINSGSYTVVVRADGSVTGVDFNLADSNPGNDDANTGQNNGNGETNGVSKFVAAAAVTPDAGLNSQYPDLPLEWRFTYTNVPATGNATITVRLKELSTTAYPDRFSTLTRTVTTAGPAQVLTITTPPTDGLIMQVVTNGAASLTACFTAALAPENGQIDYFSIYVNGVFQPRRTPGGNPLYILRSVGCSTGLRQLLYSWVNPTPGTNVINVLYTNFTILADSRSVVFARPGDSDGDGMSDVNEIHAGTDPFDANSLLRITDLANGNRLVVWDSVLGRQYRVLATTNLSLPFAPASLVIPASSSSAVWHDDSPEAPRKYYRVELLP